MVDLFFFTASLMGGGFFIIFIGLDYDSLLLINLHTAINSRINNEVSLSR